MRVLWVTNLFPNCQEPNRGIFNYHISRELQNYCDITIIAPVPWFPKMKFLKRFGSWSRTSQLPEKEKVKGFDVYHPRYIVIPGLFGFLHGFSLYYSIRRMVRNLIKKQNFDLIHAHWVFPDGVAAVRVARQMNLKVMVTAHGSDINLYSGYLLRRIQIRKALQRADSISAVSPELRQSIIELGIPDQRAKFIPNGVDPDQFKPDDQMSCRRQLGLPLDARIILFAGALVPVKGLEYLLEAAAQLKSGYSNLFIAIVGEGPLYQFLIHKTEELHLREMFIFFGSKPHDDIPLWINACDLFCLPSLSEGWPCVIMEALACGKPVVASRVGGVPNIINDQNGYMFAPKNVKDLAQSLEKALGRSWDPERIRGGLDRFSWKASAEQYYKEYRRLVNTENQENCQ